MSKQRNSEPAPGRGGEVQDRLTRLLEAAGLARVVPHLPPEALHQLIRHRGLEASAELVTAATPAQLTSLLDLDLWHGAPAGGDEQFDVERFGEWIEVLVDTDDVVAARTIASLDSNLVVAGLTRYVRVFDPGIFEPTAQSDDEAVARHEAMREGDAVHLSATPAAGLECELGGYLVRARRADAWDAIVALLTTLEVEDGGFFETVMRGCRRLSNSRPEVDGLDDLLLAPEQHLHEVASERERRRSEQGYATPADARAFLEMARQPRRSGGANPIVAAYFRTAAEAPERPQGPTIDAPEFAAAVLDLLSEAGMMPDRPRALLAAAAESGATRLAQLRRLMAYVRDADVVAHLERSRELALLANVLVAGCSVQSRPFTPQEASDAAAATCNLGLEHWPARWHTATPDAMLVDAFLVDHDLIAAFEVGWSVLHHDVGLAAASQLVAMLQTFHTVDEDVQQGLVALRRALVTAQASGTPWSARHAAEILAMLDMTAWIAVLGLLDECPILPAALTAIVEGSASTVSQTEFAFISTAGQIESIRAFLEKLPRVLSG
jgi:hypothetical protein